MSLLDLLDFFLTFGITALVTIWIGSMLLAVVLGAYGVVKDEINRRK